MEKNGFKQTQIGKMPEDWKETKLFSHIDIKHGYAFKGEYFSEKENENILLTPGNFKIGGGFNDSKFKYYTGEILEDYILKEGDIIITMTDLSKTGDTLGYPALVPLLNNKKFLHNQRLGKVIFKENCGVNKKFLYWLLRTRQYRHEVLASATGTTVKHTSPKRILEYSFFLPPFEEQIKIAQILESLEEKQIVNNQMNKNLEAIGQALFKRWFIDFEFPNEEGKPYKSSGGEMVFNEEMGKEIPKGWVVRNVQDFLVFEKGIEPGSKCYLTEYSEENIRFIRVGDISTPGRENTFIPIELAREKFCKEDDVLLSLDATIGIVRIGMDGAFSSGIRKVYSKEKGVVPKGYIYSLLTSKHIQDTIYTYANGTTILHASKSLNYMDLAVHNKELFHKFSEISEPIFNKIVNNLVKINSLEHIRDLLLPKLMSGKIRVPVEEE